MAYTTDLKEALAGELLQENLEVEEAINRLDTDTTIDWDSIGDNSETESQTSAVNSFEPIEKDQKCTTVSAAIQQHAPEEQKEEYDDISIDWLLDGLSQHSKKD